MIRISRRKSSKRSRRSSQGNYQLCSAHFNRVSLRSLLRSHFWESVVTRLGHKQLRCPFQYQIALIQILIEDDPSLIILVPWQSSPNICPMLSPSPSCPGCIGEHVAVQYQRRILPVDEAEKCCSGCGPVQTGSTETCPPYSEPAVR